MQIIITKRKLKRPRIASHHVKTANIVIYMRYLSKYALHEKVKDSGIDNADNIMKMLIRIINTEIICLIGKYHQGICSEKNGYNHCEPEIIFRAFVENVA